MKKVNLIVFLCISVSLLLTAQTKIAVKSFPLSDVRLLDSPFLNAQELDKKYLLELDADRLLAPFLREAGLQPKAESYTNWENTGLDGHIGGHYLSALSIMYASTGDKAIKERLDYMISELKRCQDANENGYIGGVPGGNAMWPEIKAGNINAHGFSLNDKWVPLYNIHKTYAGLRDAWIYAKNEEAKHMLVKMTDWMLDITSDLSDEQMQDMLRSEHGGLNETFADVAAITGDDKYLKLAHRFSHKAILDPLLNKEDQLTGLHANTQIPKVIGYKRIADLEGNKDWDAASQFFWEIVVRQRSVSIGGNSTGEHFNPTDDFSRMVRSIEGPETCNTYNMLRLSKMFFETSVDKKFVDYYERALYNHILSSQHPENGGLVYFTQMRPGHYRVYSQPQTSMWCCVGSGIENHAKYGEMIYSYDDNSLYVNLFISSRLSWKDKHVEVIQENLFPDEASTSLTINPKKKTTFSLNLRYPAWVKDNTLKVFINGKEQSISLSGNGYVSINREWKKGDKVVMEMPMSVSVEQMPDKSNYYSFFYGPILLAAKSGAEDLKGQFADDSRGGHIAHGRQIPLKDMPVIVSEPESLVNLVKPVEGKSLTFSLANLYLGDKWGKTELIPFFRLHESRYIIYWPQATKEGLVEIQRKMEQDEKETIRLDEVTIDKVVCGEQQPESDHFIQSEHSTTGFTDDIHWREARGFFSYKLKNSKQNAKYLYLSYYNRDRGRNFDIFVNDQKIRSMYLNGENNDEIVAICCRIPDNCQKEEVLTVRFAAHPNTMTTKIAEVRILSEEMITQNMPGYKFSAEEKDFVGYLFAYFRGNSVEDEQINFAISMDGYNYKALNGNLPVIDSKKISSTGGVRDPHIIRCEDGKTFYMVVTDMTSSKGWDSNRAMVLMKSTDLINWTSNVVNIQTKYSGQENLKRVWAPQTIYDREAGTYMIYWSMLHGDGVDVIYYAYANDDFTDIVGEPKQLFFPSNGKSCIDGDIVLKGDMYYMFYKTEGHGDGIKLATTKSLTSGKWTEYPDYKQQTKEAVEGSGIFKLNHSDKYIMMYDVYKKGKYQFTESTDLENFRVIDESISMDFHPRHGSVISITRQELKRITDKWGIPKGFSTIPSNPVLEGYYADPEVLYSEKTKKYYIYPTSDGFTGWGGYYFKVFSSDNLVDWKDEGIILDQKRDVSWANGNAWAPCVIEKKMDGAYKYFYYFSGGQDGGQKKIGVAVADDPLGPFFDSSKPLIDFKPEGIKGGQEIDPDVFSDPVSGKSYLYWGNGYLAVAELNEDMISLKKETIQVMTPDKTFREGIYVIYRKGTYYFLWSENDTRSEDYRVRYATAKSPTGPLIIPENNLILVKKPEDGIFGTGHNSVIQIPGKDEWYIVYHRFSKPNGITMGDAAGYHREVCMDKMEFDKNGAIRRVEVRP